MPDAIVLHGITKTFGATVAVRDLDLAVPEGGLSALIGPNGAGKTTAIRIVMSILLPDRGQVTVLGQASASRARGRIGYLPEERGLYRKMRVGQFLAYMARLKGVPAHGLDTGIRRWLARVGLDRVAARRCEELSKGMQQKVQFLAAVIHRPDLLILDEPFSGLDPVSQRLFRDIVLEEHQRGATVVFSTHVMLQAEQLCDHVVMMHRGAKVLDEPMAVVLSRQGARTVVVEPMDPAADTGPLATVAGVQRLRRDGPCVEVDLGPAVDPADTIRSLAAALPLARIELKRPTLEDVFVGIAAGDQEPDAAARWRAEVRGEAAGGTGERA